MIYPFEDAEEEIRQEETAYIPKEYGIDFETGQLTGKIAEGLEAVKVWVWFALHTPKDRYYVYSPNYGMEYEDMIGKGYSREYMETELQRMTEECLMINPFITGIQNFTMKKEESRVELSFLLVTSLGDTEVKTSV